MDKIPLTIQQIRNTTLLAFWKRLKRLGFVMDAKKYDYSDIRKPKSWFRFKKDTTVIVFFVSKYRYRFRVVKNNKTIFKTRYVNSLYALELPFLDYFGESRLLCLSRMGPQHPRIQVQLEKLREKARRKALLEKQKLRQQKKDMKRLSGTKAIGVKMKSKGSGSKVQRNLV